MPELPPLQPRIVRDTLGGYFGDRAETIVESASTGSIEARLYGVLAYRCGFSEWHQGVWEFHSAVVFGGVPSTPLGSRERGVGSTGVVSVADLEDEFARVDEHCRLLLPDKYLRRFDRLQRRRSPRPAR